MRLRATARTLAAALVAAVAGPAAAQDYTWNSSTGYWSSTANWHPNGTPSALTTAAISRNSSPYVVIVSNSGLAAKGLSITYGNAALQFTPGSDLTIGTSGLTVTAGTVNLSAGSLTLFGPSSTASGSEFDVTGGTLTASAAVTVGGAFRLDGGGAVTGTGAVTVAGSAVMLGSGAGSLVTVGASGDPNGTLNLNGAITLNGTGAANKTVGLVGNGTAGATLHVGGTLTDKGDTTVSSYTAAGGTLDIAAGGAFVKDGTAGTTDLGNGLTVNVAGTLNVQTGTLRVDANAVAFNQFNNGTLAGGTYVVGANSTLDLGGRAVTTLGDGTMPTAVTLGGANAQFGDLTYHLATISANASLTVSGGAAFSADGALAVSGTLDVGAGSSVAVQGGLLYALPGGLLGGSGTADGVVIAGTGSDIRAGEPGASNGTLTLGLLRFNNGATVDIQGGSSANTQLSLSNHALLQNSSTSDVLHVRLTDDGTLVNGQTCTWTVISSADTSHVRPADFDVQATNFTLAGYSVGVSGNAVTITFTPVPEPTAVLGVGGVGLAAVGAWRRQGIA